MLLGAVGALLGYGLWSIGGITAHDITGNPNYYLVRQSLYAAVGCLGLVAVLFIDPDYYRRHRQPIFIGTAGVMLLVLLAGTVSRHSKRWLDIGFFRFQPSEFGKLLFVLFLAGFLADRARRLGETRTVLEAIGLGVIPMVLVFLQPDVGTAMVYAAALAAVLFVAGVRWMHLAVLGVGTSCLIWPCSGCCRRPACTCSSPIRSSGSRASRTPTPIRRARRTTWPVDNAVGAGGVRAAASGRDPDEPELPAGARDRLRVRFAR